MSGSYNLNNAHNRRKSDSSSTRRILSRKNIILWAVLIGLIVYILYLKLSVGSAETRITECPNIDCYQSVVEITDQIDESVDPCEDFHQFVCGKFLENAYVKQWSSKVDQNLIELQREAEIMITSPKTKNDSHFIKIQKTFYSACVDAQGIIPEIRRNILHLIEQLGVLPMKDQQNWKEDNFDWINTMIECKKLGLPFEWFIEFGIYSDDLNYLQISYPVFSTPPTNTTTIKYINSVMSNWLEGNVVVYANNMFNFEQMLNKIVKKQQSKVNLILIEELQSKHPVFDWIAIIQNITEYDNISYDTVIASNVEEYIVDLYQLINATPKRIQANYIAWKILEYFSTYVFYDSKQVSDSDGYSSRLEFCREKTQNIFLYFTEIEYINKHLNNEVVKSARELATLIKDEVFHRLEISTWWNSTAGQMYLDEFDNIEFDFSLGLGSDNEIFDHEFLDENYLHLNSLMFDDNETDPINMMIIRTKHYYRSIFNAINTTSTAPKQNFVDLFFLRSTIFDKESNKIIVPPHMLHGTLFSIDRPKYLNYGSLGILIANALIQATDIIIEDKENLTSSPFKTSNKCLLNDYFQLSLNEQIDNVVIEKSFTDIIANDVAYTAYQELIKTNEEETSLPLLPYTANQLFWIKSGSINCYPMILEEQSDNDQVLSKYKNILGARHSPHFSNDFNCLENSIMNPPKKC